MKREGRQHGMVRSYMILPSKLYPGPEPRFINRLDSPPTAGLFTKVSSKPTNHSKFTGKCGRSKCADCHLSPACKSKVKAKGTQKTGSSDYRMVTWRVVDAKPGLKLSGLSASGILDHLDNNNDDDDYMDDDDKNCEGLYGDDDGGLTVDTIVEIENEEEEEDNMSFCEVDLAFGWEQVEGDEGWCLVEEEM